MIYSTDVLNDDMGQKGSSAMSHWRDIVSHYVVFSSGCFGTIRYIFSCWEMSVCGFEWLWTLHKRLRFLYSLYKAFYWVWICQPSLAIKYFLKDRTRTHGVQCMDSVCVKNICIIPHVMGSMHSRAIPYHLVYNNSTGGIFWSQWNILYCDIKWCH